MNHIVKIFYQDGQQEEKVITGTKDEIFTYYAENNLFNYCDKKPQVEKIQFIDSPFINSWPGCKSYTILYIDWDKTGLLQ